MKWIWVILLAIVGILAAIVAVEYLTVSIHHLPSWIPGHHPHKRGHYHKRGAISALIAVIALGAAGYLAYRFSRSGPSGPAVATGSGPAPEGASADQLLSEPPSSGGATAGQ